MQDFLFAATTVSYLLATLAYTVLWWRGKAADGKRAMAVLCAAFVLHLSHSVLLTYRPATAMSGIQLSLSFSALLLVLAYLLAAARMGLHVLGLFVTPLTLLFFLAAAVPHAGAQMQGAAFSVLLPVHIGLNVFGVVALALAFTVALVYVIQEGLLRRKHIGGLFQRLPPLDVLDALGLKLVTAGFGLLTLGIASGTLWLLRTALPRLRANQALALIAWAVLAALLLLRFVAGWRGRRAAIGTIFAFVCALAVLVGYVLRAQGEA
ncbi:MAG: cytochrome c biogenesis protein CcsA [Polyangiales bacterium]